MGIKYRRLLSSGKSSKKNNEKKRDSLVGTAIIENELLQTRNSMALQNIRIIIRLLRNASNDLTRTDGRTDVRYD